MKKYEGMHPKKGKDGNFYLCPCGGVIGCFNESAEYAGTDRPCPHDYGWYDTVKIWIFKKKVFVCEKCYSIIPRLHA